MNHDFDFTTVLDRRGSNAVAVDWIPVPGAEIDPGFSRLPMWVADMNFATAPAVLDAIRARLEHPVFGYFHMPDSWYDAIQRWQTRRNGVVGLEREHIGYENGVLGGVVSAAQTLTSPGECILVHSPVYVGFPGCLEAIGRRLVYSPLKQDAAGVWRMDYADMDAKIKKHHIRLAVICTPHNPTGRVWERQELEEAMEVFRRNGVYVLSDEIWSDLILDGRHIPLQSVSDDARARTIAYYALTKTFNLAGLVGSYHIVYDGYLRDRLAAQSVQSHYNNANVLSVASLEGAYSPEGEAWLEALLGVLRENVNIAWTYLNQRFPGVSAARPQGTYMLFPDCGGWCSSTGKSLDELLRAGIRVGVVWQDGRPFLGANHIRMNVALPTALLREAMERLDRNVFHI